MSLLVTNGPSFFVVVVSLQMMLFHFRLPYFSYIGGVLAVSREFYKKLNGFSNVFFGWGGEDDDFLMR